MQLLIAEIRLQRPHRGQRLGRVKPLNQVPGREVKKHAARHFTPTRAKVLVAQQGHDLLHVQAMVKVRAANMHTAGSQNVLRAICLVHVLRAQTHHGEVRSTTANVHDQHNRLFAQTLLIVQRCGNGFELKADLTQTRGLRRRCKRLLRLAITLGVSIDKVHWTAQHHALRQLAIQRSTCLICNALEKNGNDVLVTDQLVVHRRLLLQQGATQQAFERTHQAPLFALQVLRHGITAKVCAVLFGVEKYRRRHACRRAFQCQQTRWLTWNTPRSGRIGGTEVNTQGAGQISFICHQVSKNIAA